MGLYYIYPRAATTVDCRPSSGGRLATITLLLYIVFGPRACCDRGQFIPVRMYSVFARYYHYNNNITITLYFILCIGLTITVSRVGDAQKTIAHSRVFYIIMRGVNRWSYIQFVFLNFSGDLKNKKHRYKSEI